MTTSPHPRRPPFPGAFGGRRQRQPQTTAGRRAKCSTVGSGRARTERQPTPVTGPSFKLCRRSPFKASPHRPSPRASSWPRPGRHRLHRLPSKETATSRTTALLPGASGLMRSPSTGQPTRSHRALTALVPRPRPAPAPSSRLSRRPRRPRGRCGVLWPRTIETPRPRRLRHPKPPHPSPPRQHRPPSRDRNTSARSGQQ
jgi:hypothetical protein